VSLRIVLRWAWIQHEVSILLLGGPQEVEAPRLPSSSLLFVRGDFEYQGDARTPQMGLAPNANAIVNLKGNAGSVVISVYFSLAQLVSPTYAFLLERNRVRRFEILGFELSGRANWS
jgi:hypothetical protein